VLAAVLALYMASIHVGRSRTVRIFPKEIVVGALFASGVTLPCWSRYMQFPRSALLPFILFALLCSLNCVSIECWENCGQDRAANEPPDLLVSWADSRINRLALVLAITAFVAALWSTTAGAFFYELLAVGWGALLLLTLNCGRKKFSPRALRVLADVALLLPSGLALALPGLVGWARCP